MPYGCPSLKTWNRDVLAVKESLSLDGSYSHGAQIMAMTPCPRMSGHQRTAFAWEHGTFFLFLKVKLFYFLHKRNKVR